MSQRSLAGTRLAADAGTARPAPERWRQVVHEGRRFMLRRPIEVAAQHEDGLWVYECGPLGIIACGPTRAESTAAFAADFAACWDLVAQAPDEDLTEDARDLKGALLGLVERVEQ